MNRRSSTSSARQDDGYVGRWWSLIIGLVIGITLVAVAGLLAACAPADATSTAYIGAASAYGA
ncbi:MAG TPA: hypothetical protein VMN79_00395 [Casimicrobiaceae bacterium]|nr:hypothetical protein [Casimicrobiaceae bacterium]